MSCAHRRVSGRVWRVAALAFAAAVVAGAIGMQILRARFRVGDGWTRVSCMNNLKETGLALRMFASDHRGEFPLYTGERGDQIAEVDEPADATAVGCFGALVMHQYAGTYEPFVCPDAGTVPLEDWNSLADPASFSRHTLDYAYVAGLSDRADIDSPIAFDDVVRGDCRYIPGLACGPGSNHGASGVSVLFANGYARFRRSTAGEGETLGRLPDLDRLLQPPEGEKWCVRWD